MEQIKKFLFYFISWEAEKDLKETIDEMITSHGDGANIMLFHSQKE